MHDLQVERQRVNQTKWSAFVQLMWKDRYLIILSLPAIVSMAIFSYVPMIGMITAFQNYIPTDGFFGSKFVGFENFINFFNSGMLSKIIRNTLGISLLKLIFEFPAAIAFALLLNELRNMLFKRTIQTVTYLPHFISWVVVVGIWSKLLSTNDGLVNNILAFFHMERIPFLSTPWFMWPFAIFSDMWKEIGWSAIIYLAALSAVDPQLYEAAQVDGAGRWSQLWHITLPGISVTISTMLILSIPSIISANTDQMWVLGTLPVRDVTEVIDTYVLRTGLGNNQYSLAAAVGMLKMLVSFILLIITDKASKKISGYGIL